MNASPLARLPPELRNQIFELALTDVSGYIYLRILRNHAQLTRVCRQLRAETLALFYSLHHFRIPIISRKHVLQVCNLLQQLGPAIVCRIKKLEIAGGVDVLIVSSALVDREASEGSAGMVSAGEEYPP